MNNYDCQDVEGWKPEHVPMADYSCNLQQRQRGECEEDYGYSICSQSWYGLSIVDYGLLADMAYWKSLNRKCFDETFSKQFDLYFNPEDWTLRGVSNPDETNIHVGFYDLYSKSRNLSVISVRGTTSSTLDLLEDTDLFMEIALLRAVSFVIPIINLSPDGLVANMVKLASLPSELWFNNTKSYYYAAVLDYVKNKCSGRNVILTGHSLGAAIATIVAGKTEHKAIVFSPPGIVYSRRKFGLSLATLQKYIVSIIPTRDPVPKIDKHTGLVQHINCFASNPFSCHRLRKTVCDLNAKCKAGKPLRCPE